MSELSHYTVDETTHCITFNKQTRLYKIEKAVFASHSVDIDAIKTIDEYTFFNSEYQYDITAARKEYWQNRQPQTEEERTLKESMLESLELRLHLQRQRNKKAHPYLRLVK